MHGEKNVKFLNPMHIEEDKWFYKLVEIISGRKYFSTLKSISKAVNIINYLLLYKQIRV